MAVIRLNLTEQAERRIAELADAPARAAAALRGGLQRLLAGLEAELKLNLLRGGDPNTPRGGQLPLANRSGALAGSIGHELDGPLSGVYGSYEGPATAYARVQLDAGVTIIRPVKANHLWLPVGDNLDPSGRMRMSPREAFEQLGPGGKPRLRIFRSKRGNLVAFLPDADGARFKRNVFNRQDGQVKLKGQQKGKLLFVLKDEVPVRGTDALRVAWDRRYGFTVEIIETSLAGAIDPSQGGDA